MNNIPPDYTHLWEAFQLLLLVGLLYFFYHRMLYLPNQHKRYRKLMEDILNQIKTKGEIFHRTINPEIQTIQYLWDYYNGTSRLSLNEYIQALYEMPIECRERRINLIKYWIKYRHINLIDLYLNSNKN